MNYITYYFSRKPVGPALLVFYKPTDSPNAVCCVQFGKPIELRLTSQTFYSLCPVMHFASFPTKVSYMYDVSIGNKKDSSLSLSRLIAGISRKEILPRKVVEELVTYFNPFEPCGLPDNNLINQEIGSSCYLVLFRVQ